MVSPKTFRPIILLNTLSKLIEKIIGEKLQFQSISRNFIHPYQLDRLKQCSTMNVGVILMLNYCSLLLILEKAGFNSKISIFFQDYLVDRKMNYLWNSFSSSYFNIDFGVGQGFTLSPILSALYYSPIFYIFEKRIKNLKIPIFILSFVDNGLFIVQNKYLTVLNSYLFCSYHIIFSLLKQFRLVIKHGKIKVFHFSRLHRLFNPPLLDLTSLGGSILYPKKTWQYLGCIFDRKLIFQQYINFYVNKTLLTVKCLETHQEISFLPRSVFYIEVKYFQLHFMAFNCGSTTKHYWHILSRNSGKYNKELPFGYQKLSIPFLQLVSKLLQVSSQYYY